MKKISVLLILALLTGMTAPCYAGILSERKARIEQNQILKNNEIEIKALFNEQLKQANNHCLNGVGASFSNDFVSSDGFNKEVYLKLVEDTWETYKDISYTSKINNIEISGNYATVYMTETAVATPIEKVDGFELVGELYSESRCVYHLKKHGTVWLIDSERVIDETSTLKYGEARHCDVELIAPKQVPAGKYYTSSFKINAPENTVIVATINKDNIVYPRKDYPKAAFRTTASDNMLERVFTANKDNINENVIASAGIAYTQQNDNDEIKVLMSGLVFIMTRVNVIPENKFVDLQAAKNKADSDKNGKESVKNEQNK